MIGAPRIDRLPPPRSLLAPVTLLPLLALTALRCVPIMRAS